MLINEIQILFNLNNHKIVLVFVLVFNLDFDK